MPPDLSLFLPADDDTTRLGDRLAGNLGAGDTILLDGPIGAGKTHLARAIISHLLPVSEDIPSPTYTLVQTYQGPGFEIWHADLYRLSDSSELLELGLAEAMDTALVLIEWPDRLPPDMLPADALRISLSVEDNGRRALIDAPGDWPARLEALADA